jgi:hypothetical protein
VYLCTSKYDTVLFYFGILLLSFSN